MTTPRLCRTCGRQPARPDRTCCGTCLNRHLYPHPGRHRQPIRPRNRNPHLPASQRGLCGDCCPVCGAKVAFGTIDGTAVEWCPTHGMTVTPIERRYCGPLHDQRERLEADLLADVAREVAPLKPQPHMAGNGARNMPRMAIGRLDKQIKRESFLP